jgi:hypothetical protein
MGVLRRKMCSTCCPGMALCTNGIDRCTCQVLCTAKRMPFAADSDALQLALLMHDMGWRTLH